MICGYFHKGEEPPDIYPMCDAPKEFFRLLGNGNAAAEDGAREAPGTDRSAGESQGTDRPERDRKNRLSRRGKGGNG
jgi:hypothetical protein